MVHTNNSEGKKLKPRGRPFVKGNKRGKIEDEVLATTGSESSVEGGFLDPLLNSVGEEVKEEYQKKESEELEMVETVDFKNGENILSIRFSKLHNRSFRIQVFLNNDNEIRPVTYTGARTGYAFWNLLKGALKK